MAEHDLTALMAVQLDRHLVFPLLEFLQERQLYSEPEFSSAAPTWSTMPWTSTSPSKAPTTSPRTWSSAAPRSSPGSGRSRRPLPRLSPSSRTRSSCRSSGPTNSTTSTCSRSGTRKASPPAESAVLCIDHLSRNVNEAHLKEIFGNFGEVVNVELSMDRMVVTTGKISRQDRAYAWRELQQAAFQKKTRPFFRAVDKHGRMYAGGLDRPIQRPFILRDWRFGHYEMEGLKDHLSRFIRSIISPISREKKIHYIEDDDISYSIS